MKKLILAEKPNQAKQIADCLLKNMEMNEEKFYEDENIIVCFAIGHLLNLKKYKELTNNYVNTPLEINYTDTYISNYESDNKKQLQQLLISLKRFDVEEIICATDNDNEGDAIFKNIIEYAKSKKQITANKFSRMFFTDLTQSQLSSAFENREYLEISTFGLKGIARGIIDYNIGLNSSYFLSKKFHNLIVAGRCQTPMLHQIIKREQSIRKHVKEKKFKPEITVNGEIFTSNQKFDNSSDAKDFISNTNDFKIISTSTTKSLKIPKLLNLSEIQKYANKKLKLKSSDTLDILQKLYQKQIISYPRTDSRYLSLDVAKKMETFYGDTKVDDFYLNPGFNKKNQKEVIEDSHEAIYIATKNIDYNSLTTDEINLVTHIQNIIQSNFLEEFIYQEYNSTIEIGGIVFKNIQYCHDPDINKRAFTNLFPELLFANLKLIDQIMQFDNSTNYSLEDAKIEIKEYESKPLERYTEATLLSKMENIGNDETLNADEKLSFKNYGGIGTPATRSIIIDSLFNNEYIEEEKNHIFPTDKGIILINELNKIDSKLIDIVVTAQMQQKVNQISTTHDSVKTINEFNQFIINELNKFDKLQITDDSILGKCPKCQSDVKKIKSKDNKIFFVCTNVNIEKCFLFPSYENFTDQEILDMLKGDKSKTYVKRSKKGKVYKLRYFLDGEVLESELVKNDSSDSK